MPECYRSSTRSVPFEVAPRCGGTRPKFLREVQVVTDRSIRRPHPRRRWRKDP
jgi:hypothetical protein